MVPFPAQFVEPICRSPAGFVGSQNIGIATCGRSLFNEIAVFIEFRFLGRKGKTIVVGVGVEDDKDSVICGLVDSSCNYVPQTNPVSVQLNFVRDLDFKQGKHFAVCEPDIADLSEVFHRIFRTWYFLRFVEGDMREHILHDVTPAVAIVWFT